MDVNQEYIKRDWQQGISRYTTTYHPDFSQIYPTCQSWNWQEFFKLFRMTSFVLKFNFENTELWHFTLGMNYYLLSIYTIFIPFSFSNMKSYTDMNSFIVSFVTLWLQIFACVLAYTFFLFFCLLKNCTCNCFSPKLAMHCQKLSVHQTPIITNNCGLKI